MKTCDDFERLISDRLDGPIPSESDRELEKHLAGCASCRRFLESALAMRKQIQTLPEIAASEATATRKSQTGILTQRLMIPIPIAAALALAAMSGWLYAFGVLSNGSEDRVAPNTFVHSVEIIRADPVSAVEGSIDNDSNKTENIL